MASAVSSLALPFLSAYDPPGTSEGTLDPMGLYQIADQLAVQLVPAVRERMLRVRFLTAMAVGALLTEDLEADPEQVDAAPYLAWEWLVVEATVRAKGESSDMWGVPGSHVAKTAVDRHGYLDSRSYLKTPRIFGFNGVYKRLAVHLGIVDVHLAPGLNAERLADAWAQGLGHSSFRNARPLHEAWATAVRKSLAERPARTRTKWSGEAWKQLAEAFAPDAAGTKEKRFLRNLLLVEFEGRLGALPQIWQLQEDFTDDDFHEETLHARLRKLGPAFGPVLAAIGAYELFARRLSDAFDVLRWEAARPDARGFEVQEVRKSPDFQKCVEGLQDRFAAAYEALGELSMFDTSLQSLFHTRFGSFAEPMDAAACAVAICAHHEVVQRGKSAAGKRAWFDRIGDGRIHLRTDYRVDAPELEPKKYVHPYRGWPVRRFFNDLS